MRFSLHALLYTVDLYRHILLYRKIKLKDLSLILNFGIEINIGVLCVVVCCYVHTRAYSYLHDTKTQLNNFKILSVCLSVFPFIRANLRTS